MEYYTYAYLREDGTPYYIGKGKGRRIEKGYNKLGLRKLQLKEWKRYRDLVAVEEVSQKTL